MRNKRSELQNEVAEALVSSKAINFEVVGSIIAKYGARAVVNGDAIGAVITHRVFDVCIPVDWSHVVEKPAMITKNFDLAPPDAGP